MIKFIKLTECNGNDETKDIFVNVAHIESICKGNKGKDTYIKMAGYTTIVGAKAGFFFVKESLDEIWDKINFTQIEAENEIYKLQRQERYYE